MRGWVSLLVAIAVIPLIINEVLRFYDAYHACDEQFLSNWRLYTNPVCADPMQRRTMGDKQDRACTEAEEQNRLSPVYCAWRRMWHEGAVYHVWHMLAHSYWMQFGLSVTVIVTTLVLTAWTCNQRAQRAWFASIQQQQQQQYPALGDGYPVVRVRHIAHE